mmetsp:Transcript_13521/g.26804  ORF Transcript_13521/g.26804 Transcript_13521/m.26804 type:complete len:237 (+) Transcript_13521:745-1455(+)
MLNAPRKVGKLMANDQKQLMPEKTRSLPISIPPPTAQKGVQIHTHRLAPFRRKGNCVRSNSLIHHQHHFRGCHLLRDPPQHLIHMTSQRRNPGQGGQRHQVFRMMYHHTVDLCLCVLVSVHNSALPIRPVLQYLLALVENLCPSLFVHDLVQVRQGEGEGKRRRGRGAKVTIHFHICVAVLPFPSAMTDSLSIPDLSLCTGRSRAFLPVSLLLPSPTKKQQFLQFFLLRPVRQARR